MGHPGPTLLDVQLLRAPESEPTFLDASLERQVETACPMGMRSSCFCHPSPRPSTSIRAVSMVPGHTALTVTPWRATSWANDWVSPWMPKLAAL